MLLFLQEPPTSGVIKPRPKPPAVTLKSVRPGSSGFRSHSQKYWRRKSPGRVSGRSSQCGGSEQTPFVKAVSVLGGTLWPEDAGLLQMELAGTHGRCRVPYGARGATSACQATVPHAASQREMSPAAPRGWTRTPGCAPRVSQATHSLSACPASGCCWHPAPCKQQKSLSSSSCQVWGPQLSQSQSPPSCPSEAPAFQRGLKVLQSLSGCLRLCVIASGLTNCSSLPLQ